MRSPVTAVLNGDLNLLRCFDGTGIECLVVASDAQDLVLHSKYARRSAVIADLRMQPERALADLIELGKTLAGRPVLFYDNEPMLLLVSRNREALAPYYRFLLPPEDLVEDLADKVRFEGLARRLDLPVPKTILSQPAELPADAARRISMPCIFKPKTHVGWYDSEAVLNEGPKPYKALVAWTAADFKRRWEVMRRHTNAFVIQEFVSGGDDCIYSFHAYLDGNSRPLGQYVGRKIRTYPKTAGASTYLRLVKEPRLVEISLDILRRMDFVGAVKLDFKKDAVSGRFYLLELNSRFNLWSHLGSACGINLPQIAYRDLCGESQTPATEYRTGVRWLSLGNDVRAFLKDYRRDGDLTLWPWIWSLRGKKVCDVFSWRDPVPWAVGVFRYQKRLWQRVLRRLNMTRALRRHDVSRRQTASSTAP